jgi:hypothetical protein
MIIPIVLFVGGLFALIKGRLRLVGNLSVEGQRARVVGALLMIPLIGTLALMAIASATGHVQVGDPALNTFGWINMVLWWGPLLAAIIYIVATKPARSASASTVDQP